MGSKMKTHFLVSLSIKIPVMSQQIYDTSEKN